MTHHSTRRWVHWPTRAVSSAAVACLCVAVTAACGGSSSSGNSASGGGGATPVTVQLLWLPQAQWAGYYVALDKGFYKDAGLNVTIHPGGPNVTPTSLVASGAADFGGGIGPLDVITSASKGLGLVEVGQTDQTDYLRLVSKQSLGITSPKQLNGKTVGYFLGTELYSLKAMVAAAGGDPNSVHWTIEGTNLAPISSGSWAAGSATTMNELVTLQQEQHIALNVMDPNAYGAGYPRNGIATSSSFLKKNPKAVQEFLTATFRGWRYAFQHQDEAVGIVMKYGQNLEKSHQLAQLKAMQQIYCSGNAQTQGMGTVDPQVFSKGAQFLQQYKVISSAPSNLSSLYTNKYMQQVPMTDRSCQGL